VTIGDVPAEISRVTKRYKLRYKPASPGPSQECKRPQFRWLETAGDKISGKDGTPIELFITAAIGGDGRHSE
jgi:hypothetical protein